MTSSLIWHSDPAPVLHRPIFLIATEGLFDISSVATSALRWIAGSRAVMDIASIDPDPFYDFTAQRPTVWLDDLGDRNIAWPENEIRSVRSAGAQHDLVVLSGIEPHLRWATFARHLVNVAQVLGCETVVTVGGVAEPVPHTRTPAVFGSSTNLRLANRLGLSRPQYQGPTGLAGVLHEQLDAAGIPAIALRVGVPHYLVNAQHPQSVAALLRHLEHVLGFPTNAAGLDAEIERWRGLHDSAVAGDQQAVAFVRMLEGEFDRRAEAAIPTADDLGDAFEQFLKEQDDE
jgi:proteasome assembly chaperone (PAC2) family protein